MFSRSCKELTMSIRDYNYTDLGNLKSGAAELYVETPVTYFAYLFTIKRFRYMTLHLIYIFCHISRDECRSASLRVSFHSLVI